MSEIDPEELRPNSLAASGVLFFRLSELTAHCDAKLGAFVPQR